MEGERERLEKEAARRARHSVRRYLIAFVIGVALVLAACWLQDTFQCTDTLRLYRQLSNAFFLAGVILCGFGALTVVAAGGLFDILSYGFLLTLSVFRRNPKDRKTAKSLYDYKKEKGERYGLWFLVFTGLLFLAVAAVFTVLFMQRFNS